MQFPLEDKWFLPGKTHASDVIVSSIYLYCKKRKIFFNKLETLKARCLKNLISFNKSYFYSTIPRNMFSYILFGLQENSMNITTLFGEIIFPYFCILACYAHSMTLYYPVSVVVLHPTAKELIIGVTLYSGDLNAWME